MSARTSIPRWSNSSKKRGRWSIAPVGRSWSTTTDQLVDSMSARARSTRASGSIPSIWHAGPQHAGVATFGEHSSTVGPDDRVVGHPALAVRAPKVFRVAQVAHQLVGTGDLVSGLGLVEQADRDGVGHRVPADSLAFLESPIAGRPAFGSAESVADDEEVRRRLAVLEDIEDKWRDSLFGAVVEAQGDDALWHADDQAPTSPRQVNRFRVRAAGGPRLGCCVPRAVAQLG